MAISYSDIRNFNNEQKRLIAQAQGELQSNIKGKAANEVYDLVLGVLDKYGAASAELGAQWYEFNAERAGEQVERAVISPVNIDRYATRVENDIADWELGELSDDDFYWMMDELVSDGLTNIQRGAVFDNMRRDAILDWRINRNDPRVRYARVPVGETCAWCIMLASLGAWYLSEESAGMYDPDHFHPHCDCVVVPYTDLEDIDGYIDTLDSYRDMYYSARAEWESYQKNGMPERFAQRVDEARAKHNEDYAAGRTNVPWREDLNPMLMIMRDTYGLH